jgi:transcriptional regulator GlxA family with amidase domain
VARHVSASRRLIEIRFRDSLGHTILDEIQRVRLERVCTLLRETNRQIGEIVHACGFDSESHVSALFRRRFGCTMRDYRKTR